MQHEVMIEAVENHMPQVIVIDEIGTELEAQAARTIAERGVQLIGTAHGNNLDNLMLNPTLSDLIGGIQSVTLGDEEARRRRSQKSVLERKAPPTFDVVIEIVDRDRVMAHADVADTVDAMLRGDPVAPELRWRDEEGVHRSQSRPRPSPREQLGTERFAGLVGSGQGWRTEPGWRGESSYRGGGFRETERSGFRPGYRPGASGGWRQTRGGSGRETSVRGNDSGGGQAEAFLDPRVMPGERLSGAFTGREPGRDGARDTGRDNGRDAGRDSGRDPGRDPSRLMTRPPSASLAEAPFVAGEIADRGPLERGAGGATVVPEPRAREAREVERQKAWRDQAARALTALKADEGTGPVNADALTPPEEVLEDEEVAMGRDDAVLHVEGAGILPTIRVLPHGISRKRLEQAIRELQLPVVIAHDVDDAEVVMTLKSEYRQKTPTLREAEERSLPIYVLKSNTMLQIQASLTSIFALEVDPREAALRETEDAIDLVLSRSEPVELSPQNAFIRRLQHQMAERANVVSRSRGREPYRRVRLYPDQARTWR
jgi:hypothetical protein